MELALPLAGRILQIRGQRVLLDSDLALLYGVPTKRLNEQVKRNRKRFPRDFMFRLTRTETNEVVANCDHLKHLKFSPNLPQAFTEHGAVMLASVLSSERAVRASVYVVRAFIQLRHMLRGNTELANRLLELEMNCDMRFKEVIEAIRKLADLPPPAKVIGFIP